MFRLLELTRLGCRVHFDADTKSGNEKTPTKVDRINKFRKSLKWVKVVEDYWCCFWCSLTPLLLSNACRFSPVIDVVLNVSINDVSTIFLSINLQENKFQPNNFFLRLKFNSVMIFKGNSNFLMQYEASERSQLWIISI